MLKKQQEEAAKQNAEEGPKAPVNHLQGDVLEPVCV